MSVVIDVRAVTKRFGRQLALDAVSLRVDAGQLVAVVGRSGSGKTTLLSLLAGFSRPDSGVITGASDLWGDTAVVPQTLGLLDELTARENTSAPLRLRTIAGHSGDRAVRRRTADDAAGAVLAELGMGELADRFVGEMSAGQRQRVAVARALVGEPRLLLADEPTSHLDDDARTLVIAAIERRLDTGMAAVVVTHDPVVHAAAGAVLEIGTEPATFT
jgi:putative ABC transport system ATP-binding protein